MKKYIYCQTGQAYEVERQVVMEWANRKGATTWVYLKDAKGIRQPVNMLLLEAQIHTTLSDVSELTIKKAFACSRSRQKSGYMKMIRRAKVAIGRTYNDTEWCADPYVPSTTPECKTIPAKVLALLQPYKSDYEPVFTDGKTANDLIAFANEVIKTRSEARQKRISLKELGHEYDSTTPTVIR